MRLWMAWLLVFGLMAGTALRAVAHDHGVMHQSIDCCSTHDECGDVHGHEEEHPAPCVPDCPEKHHHHHGHNCCVTVSMAIETEKDHIIIVGGRTVDVLRAAHDRIPCGPVFETDIPPLI